jgi:hypothetical protein
MEARLTLCFRCEHRAKASETKGVYSPRFECSDFNHSVSSCYMYLPVIPLIIEREKKDKRPLSLNIFSCRVKPIRRPTGEYDLKRFNRGILVYWKPEDITKRNDRKNNKE